MIGLVYRETSAIRECRSEAGALRRVANDLQLNIRESKEMLGAHRGSEKRPLAPIPIQGEEVDTYQFVEVPGSTQ